MEHETAANARERKALEELRQREAAEDRIARERESELGAGAGQEASEHTSLAQDARGRGCGSILGSF